MTGRIIIKLFELLESGIKSLIVWLRRMARDGQPTQTSSTSPITTKTPLPNSEIEIRETVTEPDLSASESEIQATATDDVGEVSIVPQKSPDEHCDSGSDKKGEDFLCSDQESVSEQDETRPEEGDIQTIDSTLPPHEPATAIEEYPPEQMHSGDSIIDKIDDVSSVVPSTPDKEAETSKDVEHIPEKEVSRRYASDGLKKGSNDEAIKRKQAKTAGSTLETGLTKKKRKQTRKGPPKYQGLDRSPTEKSVSGKSDTRRYDAQRDRSLPIHVRILFERGGFCTVSLIPRRADNLPEEMTVMIPGGSLDLYALQDEWFQDVQPPDISELLHDGVEWHQEHYGRQYRWILSGRGLYVMAARQDLRGYILQDCLELGREHVVLCVNRLRAEVENAIHAAGGQTTDILGESLGAPQGWLVYRGVKPTVPVKPVEGPDILNALRPLPAINISLEGGIRLQHTEWLEGYPPLIRVYGDAEHITDVVIDGALGAHTVWCGGLTRTYNIVPFEYFGELWDAYSFQQSSGTGLHYGICGPLVREFSEEHESRSSLVIPQSNSIVIGAKPGQYLIAATNETILGAPRLVFPSFSAVWALPMDPSHSDKAMTNILLLGKQVSPDRLDFPLRRIPTKSRSTLQFWCTHILDASRKGLRVKPDSESVKKLWREYKSLAQSIRRALK